MLSLKIGVSNIVSVVVADGLVSNAHKNAPLWIWSFSLNKIKDKIWNLNTSLIFFKQFSMYRVNIGSGNGLLPDGTKPSPEPMFTTHE